MGEEFALGLTQLRDRASSRRTAMMCSEALWWRCHRRLIADRLLVGGDMVWHISSRGRASKHRMTPFASVGAGGRITYPSAEAGNPQASSGAPAAAIEGVASEPVRPSAQHPEAPCRYPALEISAGNLVVGHEGLD